MGNDIRDSTGTNEEHSSLKLSVYSTFISKLDKTDKSIKITGLYTKGLGTK